MAIAIAFAVCIFATTLGGITGIGGGTIIKPMMDAMMPELAPSEVNFLSGCTVLAMAIVNRIKTVVSGTSLLSNKTVALAFGAAVGGVVGSVIFDALIQSLGESPMIKFVQNVILMLMVLAIFVYIYNKKKIKTLKLESLFVAVLIGIALGMISAFLGIGGGPANVIALYYFFSMTPKAAAQNSVFIILLSQIFSFGTTALTGIPSFDVLTMVFMVLGGVLGGYIGGALDKVIDDAKTEKMYNIILVAIVMLSGYNAMMAIL